MGNVVIQSNPTAREARQIRRRIESPPNSARRRLFGVMASGDAFCSSACWRIGCQNPWSEFWTQDEAARVHRPPRLEQIAYIAAKTHDPKFPGYSRRREEHRWDNAVVAPASRFSSTAK